MLSLFERLLYFRTNGNEGILEPLYWKTALRYRRRETVEAMSVEKADARRSPPLFI